MTLQIVERNTFDHVMCPNCSRMHQIRDRSGLLELPTRCVRCRCPLDPAQAKEFMDGRAKAEHSDAISEAGAKLRGERVTPSQMAQLQETVDALRIEVAELRRTKRAEK